MHCTNCKAKLTPSHKTLKWAMALTLAANLAACSDMPTRTVDFLTPTTVAMPGTTLPAVDPRQVQIQEVAWLVPDTPELTAQDRDQLRASLRAQLQQQLAALPVPAQSGRPLLLRAAITRVDTVNPALNTALTVLLIGPLDRGGAAVQLELLDAQTHQPLASYSKGLYAPITDIKARFDRLAPAHWALQQAAQAFVGPWRGGAVQAASSSR